MYCIAKFVIAKSMSANSPNLQLHGTNFDGYAACPPPNGERPICRAMRPARRPEPSQSFDSLRKLRWTNGSHDSAALKRTFESAP